jgi:hypothetical protein
VGQIPSNIDHQEGQHRADSGAPPAWPGRRDDGSEYEPFWAAAEAVDLPLSLHRATRRQGRIRGAGDRTLRDASSHATKAFYPALSLCEAIYRFK